MKNIDRKLNIENKTKIEKEQDISINNIIPNSNDQSTHKNKSVENSKDKPKLKSYKIIIIIILISFIILLSVCLLVLKLILKKKKKKGENNKIIALYKVEEGKTFSFFNKYESNLKENDFFIKKKSFLKINLRNLNNLEINDIFYTPKESGNLTVEISFKKNLTSLKDFFKNTNSEYL